MAEQWSEEKVRALGLTTDPRTAFRVLGIGETAGYRQLRNGTFPVRSLKIGANYRIPVANLLVALGIEPDTNHRQLTA